MQEYLSDLEVTKVEQFCKDEALYNAVYKVLLAGIYTHGTVQRGFEPKPLENGALTLVSYSTTNPVTDEILGQHIRGVWEGLNALQNAFSRLNTIKTQVEVVESPYNEAI
jgi:hypothetical protein